MYFAKTFVKIFMTCLIKIHSVYATCNCIYYKFNERKEFSKFNFQEIFKIKKLLSYVDIKLFYDIKKTLFLNIFRPTFITFYYE